jgi:hypothetical protein
MVNFQVQDCLVPVSRTWHRGQVLLENNKNELSHFSKGMRIYVPQKQKKLKAATHQK